MNIKINTRRKRILSLIIAFSMILSSFNFNLFNSKAVHAKEITNVEATVSINDAIEAVIECMNKDYYGKKGGSLEGEAYAAMFRAGANIEKKGWSVKKDTSTYGLAAFGSKVTQALALMDLDEDPTTYKNINLISDIAEEISKVSCPKNIGINEVKALILLDRYNQKFSNKKVDYNVENAIKNLIGAQEEDGSINSVPQNTAAALVVLNKHKDIDGVSDCISKALDYLHKSQRDDGGILTSKSFNTKINAESVNYLVLAGEDLTSKQWTKNGKTSIDALFNLWNGKSFLNSTGTIDYYSIPKVLDALVSLKKAGYGDYQIKGIKFDNVKKEEPEKTCKVNVAIVLPENGKYVSYFKPQEVTISSKEHNKGLTALGALQASTKMYQMSKNMVISIFGYENKGSNGWMYTVNGVAPDIMAGDYEVKAGDKIIWYYSMNGKAPTWEELTGEKKNEDEEKKIIKVNLAIEGYKGLILDAKDIKAKEGETVAEIFERVLNEKKIEYINKGGYISMIGGQEEKDRGTYSGWKYSVNGKFPNIGVAGYNPKKGDNIRFIFVKGFMDEVPYIDINNIKLDATSLNLKVGETTKLNVTITPENATDKKVIWTSDDETIVSVDEKGNIKALKEGKAIVKASTEKIGKLEAKEVECEIIVKAKNKPVIQKGGSNINTIIDGVIDYYNNEHFVTNQSQLVGYEYSAMYRAGADLSKKQWYLNEKFESSFDKELKYVGNMADQSLILIDLDKDPNNYDGRQFINEIAQKIDGSNDYFAQSEIRCVIALDKYNEKFSNKKVNYNEKHAIEKILDAQCEDGGFKERKTSTIINTGYALMALSKHKDIEGVNGAISKALTYLHDVQKDDGGFYDKSFITGNHVEALRGLIAVGENPTSKEWTKSSGKNPVDALFTLWKDNNSFDAQKGESTNNRGWVEATWKALYALVDLKEAGYGEYLVNGVKVKGLNDGEDDKEEKICKVNVAIVLPENGKYVSYFKPQEVTISDKKHDKGFTALGALQASTTLYKILGKMVTSIYGYENKGLNGWMYSVNGVIPNIMAEDYKVKDGDKIIWYYSIGGMDGKKPTWEELTGGKPEEKPDENPTEDNSIEPKLVEVFAGESFTLNIKMDKGNYFVYESEIPGVNNGNIKIENGIKFNIPKDAKAGEYKLKNIVIYNIDESSLEKFPDEIKQGLLEKMLGDEENKVTNLPDITVVIKDESIEPKQKEYEKEVEKAINDVKEYYKEFNGSFGKTYNYITSMALRHLGVDTSEIASKANIYGMDNIHNTARNIMNIIAMGENPENYNGKNYIKLLLDDNKKFYDDDSGYVAKAIIALDMAETNYDSEEAIKALISKAHDEGDGKYSFGSEEDDEWSFDSEYVVNIDDTIVVLIALANHKDVEGVTEKINGIKKYLKTLQTNNGFIKQKTSWSEEESCHITANMIQALIALGEDPLSNEWTKEDEKGNKVNMLDAILSCKEGKEFKGNRNAALTSDIDTSAAFAALVDLSKNKSMYNELRYKKIGEPSVIKIKGESEISLIKGEERLLIAETFDSNGIKVENTKFVWESSNKDICSVEDGKLKGIKKGNTDITVKLLNNEKISKTINITVTEDKDYREKIKKSLDKLKIYYDKHNSYDYMSALALHHISDDLNSDLKKIGSSLRLYRKDYAIHYAKNIMEIIAAGKNVKDYNNKNYIKLLTDSQSTNGEFIVNNSGDADKIVTLSLSIIALDMAEADYNVEKAINRLVSMVKDGKHEIDGLYTEVETKALAITALSKHKDIDEVNEAIKSSLEYIKNNQNEDAGFDHAGYKNNPFAIGTVIQALIANNIDPLSWSKNGKTMLDVLIERQMENGGFEYNESLPNTPKNEIFDDFKCTETAFAALADMYNMKSMYHEIRFNREQPKEEEPKPEKKSIEIENLTTDKEFKLGCDAEVTIKATNKTEENKDAALIVGLFNKDGQFVNYGAAEQNIKVNENVNLTVGLQLPKEGEYTVKAFVWNSLNEMEPLSKVIEIPVK